MLFAKKIPVKKNCGDTQNCGKMPLHYTHLHPSDFLISWVSKTILREQCTTPKETNLNCIELHQDRAVFFRRQRCQAVGSLMHSRQGPTWHSCCWYQRSGLDDSGPSLQSVFFMSPCCIWLPFPQISTCKKEKKNKGESWSVCFLKCPMS